MGQRLSDITKQQALLNGENRIKGWCRQFGLKDTQTDNIPEEVKKCFDKNVKDCQYTFFLMYYL